MIRHAKCKEIQNKTKKKYEFIKHNLMPSSPPHPFMHVCAPIYEFPPPSPHRTATHCTYHAIDDESRQCFVPQPAENESHYGPQNWHEWRLHDLCLLGHYSCITEQKRKCGFVFSVYNILLIATGNPLCHYWNLFTLAS